MSSDLRDNNMTAFAILVFFVSVLSALGSVLFLCMCIIGSRAERGFRDRDRQPHAPSEDC